MQLLCQRLPFRSEVAQRVMNILTSDAHGTPGSGQRANFLKT